MASPKFSTSISTQNSEGVAKVTTDVFDEPQREFNRGMFGAATKSLTVTGDGFSDQKEACESTDGRCLIVTKISMEADANGKEELV